MHDNMMASAEIWPIVARAAELVTPRRPRKALHVRDIGSDEWWKTLGITTKQMVARRPLASGADVLLTIAVALAYFLTARLSLTLLDPADGVALFWPAGGVASGILVALGPAAQLPVVLGVVAATIAANLLGDRNIWSSLFFAVTNAGEVVIIAGLITAFVDLHSS